jgi:hypothetical protein
LDCGTSSRIRAGGPIVPTPKETPIDTYPTEHIEHTEIEPESRTLWLLHKERYHPLEAAYLPNIDVAIIFRAAFAKELEAEIIGHDVVHVSRDALITRLHRADPGVEREIGRSPVRGVTGSMT